MPNLEEKDSRPLFPIGHHGPLAALGHFHHGLPGARAYPNTLAVTAMAFDEGASLSGNESIDSVVMRSVDRRVR